ncbi:xylosyltransferase 1-like isoform X1 [Branchiostoma floridae]|uniref:protein xylosyltransferase n=1 Tax=Branchiostoma floridae TaxID=7739 RepID=A0A9J7M7C3_BRAFL|nr:xylosyltransferase 1-like isoform X1 [Branchiostoma floridae]
MAVRLRRVCLRYRRILFVALGILLFQTFIAWNFYTISQEESERIQELKDRIKRESESRRKRSPSAGSVDLREVLKGEETSTELKKRIRGNSGTRESKFNDSPDRKSGSNSDFLHRNPALENSVHKYDADSEKKASIWRNSPGSSNKSRDFSYVPKCEIKGKDAVSALSRAKTAQCKQQLADTACLMQEGKLFPEFIPRYCPVDGKPAHKVPMEEDYFLHGRTPVRIAFVMVVHGRAIRQVKRLLKAIYHQDHYYLIHVDKRSHYLHRELQEAFRPYHNIRFTTWRMSTIWGGASLLQMLLRCMNDLRAMYDWKWDFFINLSGTDYPTKPIDQLTAFLTLHREENFLKSHGRDDNSAKATTSGSRSEPYRNHRFIKKQGLDRVFYECDTHMWRLGDRKIPEGILIDGGSDWVALNRAFCDYVTSSDDELVTSLKHFYKYTLLPAESFFHTVLENSAMCLSMVDNNLRITNWNRKLGCKCQYKHIVDWCGCSPNDFKPDDFHKLQTNRPTFFARKFEAVVNQDVINQLDFFLYNDLTASSPGINSYWESFFHHKDPHDKHTDTYRTHLEAFARMAQLSLQSAVSQYGKRMEQKCLYTVISPPREGSIYMRGDQLRGLIVTFDVESDGGEETLEVWVVPRNMYKMVNPTGPIGRLLSLEVGSEWDLKERIFRNMGRLIGPHDSPTVIQRWSKSDGANFIVSIVWVDPANTIAASYDLTVEPDAEFSYHTPPFQKPLKPGAWHVYLLHHWKVVAETAFLVSPMAYKNNRPISAAEAATTHAGPSNGTYIDRDFVSLNSFLKLKDVEKLAAAARMNSLKAGRELEGWIDQLVSEFWSVADVCSVAPFPTCNMVKQCQVTTWSSFSPDTKSQLGPVMPDGRIR